MSGIWCKKGRKIQSAYVCPDVVSWHSVLMFSASIMYSVFDLFHQPLKYPPLKSNRYIENKHPTSLVLSSLNAYSTVIVCSLCKGKSLLINNSWTPNIVYVAKTLAAVCPKWATAKSLFMLTQHKHHFVWQAWENIHVPRGNEICISRIGSQRFYVRKVASNQGVGAKNKSANCW